MDFLDFTASATRIAIGVLVGFTVLTLAWLPHIVGCAL